MKKLIWSNIVRRRGQSLLTMAITALTVLSFVVVLGVFWTMRHGIALSQERLGADVVVLPKDASASGYDLLFTANPENIYMPASVAEEIAGINGVKAASPQFYSQTLSGSCCDYGYEMRVVGFDPNTDFILAPYLHLRNYDRLADNEIILGGNFTDFMGTSSMVLGHKFNVVGELYPTGSGMDNTIFMNIDVARSISEESEGLSGIWSDRSAADQISVVMVKLKDGVSAADFTLAVLKTGLPVQCVATSDTITSLHAQLTATVEMFFLLWAASLLIAALALFGRFHALARERRKEIGLMRAIGVQKNRVFGLIVGEALTMAFLGGVVGGIGGCLCTGPMIGRLRETFFLSSSLWNLKTALLCGVAGVALAVLLGFLAAILPAAQSASLDPQAAIAQGELN